MLIHLIVKMRIKVENNCDTTYCKTDCNRNLKKKRAKIIAHEMFKTLKIFS